MKERRIACAFFPGRECLADSCGNYNLNALTQQQAEDVVSQLPNLFESPEEVRQREASWSIADQIAFTQMAVTTLDVKKFRRCTHYDQRYDPEVASV